MKRKAARDVAKERNSASSNNPGTNTSRAQPWKHLRNHTLEGLHIHTLTNILSHTIV